MIKKEIKSDDEIQKIYITAFNMFEILVILYCLIFFCDTLPKDFIKIINTKIYNNAVNNIYFQNEIGTNTKIIIKGLSSRENIKNNSGIWFLSICTSMNIINIFYILKNVNIVKIYIKNNIYNIVYSIYNKSRKKCGICSNKLSKLCFN